MCLCMNGNFNPGNNSHWNIVLHWYRSPENYLNMSTNTSLSWNISRTLLSVLVSSNFSCITYLTWVACKLYYSVPWVLLEIFPKAQNINSEFCEVFVVILACFFIFSWSMREYIGISTFAIKLWLSEYCNQ